MKCVNKKMMQPVERLLGDITAKIFHFIKARTCTSRIDR